MTGLSPLLALTWETCCHRLHRQEQAGSGCTAFQYGRSKTDTVFGDSIGVTMVANLVEHFRKR